MFFMLCFYDLLIVHHFSLSCGFVKEDDVNSCNVLCTDCFHSPMQGCTHGRHSNEKPQEPLRPEVSSEKAETRRADGGEIIYRGPKSAEALQRDRPR